MTRIYALMFILALLSLAGNVAKASHIYGADFFYEHTSGDDYKISLVIYGDCGGSAFPSLNGASPSIMLRRHGMSYYNFNLVQDSAGVEVTPVCPAQWNNTNCKNTSNPIPGVTRYTYTKVITLSDTSSGWEFYYEGSLSTSYSAGRSNSISNISISASNGSLLTLKAALNNTMGPNSSPRFNTIPTPFYCINVAQQYNQGATDADHDSLVYALAPGLEGLTGTVNYVPPYTAIAPLATATGAFSFSSTTGQMAFTPNAVQRSLVVNQVTEYRNGILVGTASREMTFIVLNNCNYSITSAKIDNAATTGISGGVPAGTTVFNACMNADSIRFDIVPLTVGSDTLTATVVGLPAGATASIAQNISPRPVVTFIWKHGLLAPGNYNFFINYKNNGCPLSSQQTQAFTIQVLRPSGLITSIVAPTQCAHKALVEYRFSNGVMPRKISVMQGSAIVRTFTDTTGVVRDSLGAGQYIVNINSPSFNCSSSYPIIIVDSGTYPYTPGMSPVYYCLNDPSRQLTAQPDSGGVVHWYDQSGNLLPGPPTPRTDTAGIFIWYASQHVKVCESRKDSMAVYVTKRPVAAFVGPPIICLDDTASYLFTGRIGVGPIIDYVWDWGDAGYTTGHDAGPWQIHWFSAGVKIIRLHVEENKCASAEVQDSIIVKPVPYAGFNADNELCQYDTLRVSLYNTKHFPGEQYTWNFDGAEDMPSASGPGPYTVRWDAAGTRHISLSVNLDGCINTRSADITVRPVPDIRIVNVPGPVCIGDKIFLSATGGVKYVWSPQDSLLVASDGRMYAQILKPSVYKVVVTSDYGCIDSAAVSYNDVEPCCNFSYPNAFTPNGDGRNDRFRVVTYGNQKEYELSIYNKWGQRVYYGTDAQQGWDGTFGGKPCDGGTYFYYLNAKCFTGHQEMHKGDVTLVR